MGFFKTPKNYIYILNGHDLGNDALKSQERFRQLLLTLSEKSKLVSFDNAVKLIKSNTKVDKPHIAFSFDDGFKDCIQIASILEEFGITGGFFICPKYIEGMGIDVDRKGDLYKFKNEIKHLLEREIISRYYYQRGQIEISLKNDPVLDEAIKTLENKKLYQSILAGTNK